MSSPKGVGLPEALERAASALPAHADDIRPANGDPATLLNLLDAAAAAEVLTWLLAQEPADAAELADAWAEDSDRGAPILLGLGEEDLPKVGRKVLRRARHRLRSRGFEVPEAKPAAVVAKLPRVEDSLEESLVSSVDPRGAQVALIAESQPGGGARLFQALLDDERGIVELRVFSAGRSKIRLFLREFTQGGTFASVSAPPESVRERVKRVAARQPADRPVPRAFTEWRGHLTEAPAGALTPGELAREALGSEGDLDAAAALVREGGVGPWPTRRAALQELAEKLAEIGKSPILTSAASRREQAEQAVEAGLGTVFADAAGRLAAVRFEENAYVLWKSEREADARACLAASRAFREEPAADNPVARAMLDVVLAPIVDQMEQQTADDEEGSRIVEPGAQGSR